MKSLGRGAIATTPGTTLYTVPTGYKCDVQDMLICNTSASSATFSVYFVPSGGSASTSNAVFYTAPIAAYETVHWEGLQTLNNGDFIKAIGSASGITMNVSGTEYRDKV